VQLGSQHDKGKANSRFSLQGRKEPSRTTAGACQHTTH